MIGSEKAICIKDHRFVVRSRPQRPLVGVSSFKTCNWLAQDFANADFVGANKTRRWVDKVQRMLNRQEAVLRVFLTTEDWGPVDAGEGLFGSPPRDPGIWPMEQLRTLVRPTSVTALCDLVLQELFSISAETGCVFELVVDATLKHTSNLGDGGIIGHVIRQTARRCRELSKKWPTACILFNPRNEWNAHDQYDFTVDDINRWVMRGRRWKRIHEHKTDKDGHLLSQTQVSYTMPENHNSDWVDWAPEQWPEGVWIIDPGGGDTFTYAVGPAPNQYNAGIIHPLRTGRDWTKLPDMGRLRSASNGMPIGANESMFAVDPKLWDSGQLDGWFRNPNGLTSDLGKWMTMADNWINGSEYFIFHYMEGVQADPDHPEVEAEARIREYFRGSKPSDPDLPEPAPQESPYQRLVEQLYQSVLGRKMDKNGGHYIIALRNNYEDGREKVTINNISFIPYMSYEQVRDELIRSDEFREKGGDA